MSTAQGTPQLGEWRGEFGREYTIRNCLTPQQVDALWVKNYGVTRTELNRRFLAGIPADARILEVGCNMGNQLLLLQQLGYSNLHGVDVQNHALEMARSRTKNVNLAGVLVRAAIRRQILRPGFHLGSPDPYLAEKYSGCPERNSPMCKELHLGLRVLRIGRNRNRLLGSQ